MRDLFSTPLFDSRRVRRGLRRLLLLPLLPALAGCGSQVLTQAKHQAQAQQTLAEASRYAQVDADDKQARQWVDRAIALTPNDPAVYFGTALPGDTGTALEFDVAQVFSEVGDDPALADYMAQATQKFPDDYRGYQILGDAQGRLGRGSERRATAAKLVAVLSKRLQAPGVTGIPELTAALAQARIDSGDQAGGFADYQKAVQAYPTLPLPANNLAYAYAVANTSLPQALTLAQSALALARKQGQSDEETATFLDTLGWVQYRMGKYADAQQNIQEAAAALPRLPEVRYHLGMVYIAEGKTDAARAELGHAVLLSSSYAAAKQALGRLPKPAPS